mmetsp:Transcript_2255/g.4828  ORF Transcript_2255/g.4828 Transcript_2255/m.4828 type:complete len:256 (+) Transcript_2255:153-920(+)
MVRFVPPSHFVVRQLKVRVHFDAAVDGVPQLLRHDCVGRVAGQVDGEEAGVRFGQPLVGELFRPFPHRRLELELLVELGRVGEPRPRPREPQKGRPLVVVKRLQHAPKPCHVVPLRANVFVVLRVQAQQPQVDFWSPAHETFELVPAKQREHAGGYDGGKPVANGEQGVVALVQPRPRVARRPLPRVCPRHRLRRTTSCLRLVVARRRRRRRAGGALQCAAAAAAADPTEVRVVSAVCTHRFQRRRREVQLCAAA